jgi:ABC-type glycerol-3-phosphate transport system substrate-binding protein
MGEEKVLKTFKGELSYNDADWVKVLDLFRQMRDSGVLADGTVTMVNKTAEQLFAGGRAAFAFNGSWCVNVYEKMNPRLDYAAMLPPRASEAFPMRIWGGAGSSFMVNAGSGKREEAVKFLRWLSDTAQQAYLAEATNNLPANKDAAARIPAILGSFAKGMEQATHPNLWGVAEFSVVLEAFDRGLQSIIIGEKPPEQVAVEVQRIKERELARKR